jgi:mannose-6-phosphate isomerase
MSYLHYWDYAYLNKIYSMNYIEKRPWGQFEILLDSKYCKVKKLTVNPGGRLSYQYHYNRSEVWTIVSGTATITLDDKIKWYDYGKTIKIPQGTKHRVENREQEPLIFIEVQHGSSFEEEDIVRIEDDYNRK